MLPFKREWTDTERAILGHPGLDIGSDNLHYTTLGTYIKPLVTEDGKERESESEWVSELGFNVLWRIFHLLSTWMLPSKREWTDKQREGKQERKRRKNIYIVRERRQNLERVPLVWSLPFDQSGLGGPNRRRSSRQLSSQGRRDTHAPQPRQGYTHIQVSESLFQGFARDAASLWRHGR